MWELSESGAGTRISSFISILPAAPPASVLPTPSATAQTFRSGQFRYESWLSFRIVPVWLYPQDSRETENVRLCAGFMPFSSDGYGMRRLRAGRFPDSGAVS
jgi:hypothetical protein